MAVLLKVKNAQAFVKELNKVLSQNSIRGKSDEGWIIENFPNGEFYTHYTPQGKWNNKAWFRVCPDDSRRSFNEAKGTSYNLIFRLHGTKGDNMTKELYSFYHGRFIEFLFDTLLDEIKEVAMTAALEDIQKLDKFANYDWR